MAAERVQILHDSEQACVALQPVRIQILERLGEPKSASSLAPGLGIPRQQVNYHLRELERIGLVELVEERKKGNVTERLYRSVANSFLVSPLALGLVRPNPASMQNRASTDYQVAVGARLIEDLSTFEGPVPTLTLETAICFESQEARGQFAEELAKAIANLAAKFHHKGSEEPYRMVIAVHPEARRLS
jgi:DNA-binding transcriptional ArsR family regulator